jgi:hypothetical protein
VVIYPDTLKAILIYIEALDELEKRMDALTEPGNLITVPYMVGIPLKDGDGVDWGTLQNEDGVGWSWNAPS